MSAADSPYLPYGMLNATMLALADLKISPLGSGFMTGEGVFETIRVEAARPVLFESHQARLSASLRSFDAKGFSSRGELHVRCMRVIAANSLVRGSLKIIVFKEAGGWSELILARQPGYTPAHYERGFRLKTFPGDFRVDPINGLKSLNYLRNTHARRAAVAAGFDDALFIGPQQQVLEGAATNVFVVKDRVIRTPPLSAWILPGVMRGAIIRKFDAGVREQEVTRDDLRQADEVFVTNALLGIMPVAAVDEQGFDLAQNPVTRSLMAKVATLAE